MTDGKSVKLSLMHCALVNTNGHYLDLLFSGLRVAVFSSRNFSAVKGLMVNFMDENKCTPLMFACAVGNEYAIRVLLDRHADVHMKDNFEWTALM